MIKIANFVQFSKIFIIQETDPDIWFCSSAKYSSHEYMYQFRSFLDTLYNIYLKFTCKSKNKISLTIHTVHA